MFFKGWSAESNELALDLRLPDGTTDSTTIEMSEGEGAWSFQPLPSDLGRAYELTATQFAAPALDEPSADDATKIADLSLVQSTITASARLEVVPAHEPILIAIVSSGRPGTIFEIALAGFNADSTVALYLYRNIPEDGWEFQASLPSVTVDQYGQAMYALPSGAEDPPGTYAVVFMDADCTSDNPCGVSVTINS